jgi:hypothetical protein
MLSEAKHLRLLLRRAPNQIDQRFFAPLRMTRVLRFIFVRSELDLWFRLRGSP